MIPFTLKHLTVAAVAVAFSFDTNLVFGHDDELEEIVVVSSRTHRTLADTPLRVQILGEGELREKANMKPGDIRMMLNESTGIQVQQTSATSFNSSVRIQGLDGRYTQMLLDGLPIYSGFSGSLSLLQISPLDLEQVEVVKGASSTLYGGGSIAGLVNLISKTPGHDPESSLMLNLTSAEGLDLSYFHSQESGDHGTTLFASYNRGEAYDAADNGLSAIPEFERVTITPRWFYELSEQTKINVGAGFIGEDRLGGSMAYINQSATNEFFERNDSRRGYVRFGIDHHLTSGNELSIKGVSSVFDRTLETASHQFGGTQTSNFIEASVAGNSDVASWVTGINLSGDSFDQAQRTGYVHDYSEHTLGAFAQYTHDLSDTVVIEAGLRGDAHSDYGEFLLPRASLMLLPIDDLTVRIGGGFGYKTPNLFISDAEETLFDNLVPIDPNLFKAETSKGANIDINYRWEFSEQVNLTSNLLFFYTKIDDPLQVVEVNGEYQFSQPNATIDTSGIETNLIFGMGELRYFLGHTYVDAQQNTDTGSVDLNMVSKHRVNQVLVWEHEDNFRIGLEAYYFSEQKRDNDTTGKSYWIYGLMTEKTFNESITGFLNFENFTDTRQTKFESINRGDLVNPDFRDIYAPLDGFVINGGLRIKW